MRAPCSGSVPQTDFTDAMQFIAHASKRIIQSAPATQVRPRLVSRLCFYAGVFN